MVQIRDMTKEDAENVSRIYLDSWRRTYDSILDEETLDAEIAKRFSTELQISEAEDPEIITLVAEKDGVIIGVSSASMDGRNQAWIDRMHVLPDFQGSGIADDLLTATLVKHTGLQSIALKVLAENSRAIAFYKKHGFAETDQVKDDPQVGGADTVVMSRTISRG